MGGGKGVGYIEGKGRWEGRDDYFREMAIPFRPLLLINICLHRSMKSPVGLLFV
jgi:hypothetical protein